MFQLTRPRGTRPTNLLIRKITTSFNSRVRGGRDTRQQLNQAMTLKFQLTRPRGTRPSKTQKSTYSTKFQLTRPRGTRRARQKQLGLDWHVSTHASAGDATGMRAATLQAQYSFNSRVRGGRDKALSRCVSWRMFQLTRPRGTRPRRVRDVVVHIAFQLTRPRGTRPT